MNLYETSETVVVLKRQKSTVALNSLKAAISLSVQSELKYFFKLRLYPPFLFTFGGVLFAEKKR